MQPKVSVVIVFLNGENFIQEAIDSVFAQAFGDFELILVNDGSTDASGARAKRLAETNAKVRYAEHPGCENRGLGAGRVLGAETATGECLIYLDHDDLLYPDALSQMVAALDATPAADAVFATTLFWAYDKTLDLEDYTQTFDPLPDGVIDGRAFLRRLLKAEDMHPATCSTLYRRSALNAARGEGTLLNGMYEDTALLARLLNRGDVYLLNRPVSAYRMHGKSMCNAAKADGTHTETGDSQDRYRYLTWLRGALKTDLRTRLRIERELMAYDHPRLLAALQKLRPGL